MKEKNNVEKKIEQIEKYYKKNVLLYDIRLINYEGFNIYIRLDYLKKHNTYRLSWFDIDLIKSNNIEKYISYEYVSEETAKLVMSTFEEIEEIKLISEEQLIRENIVIVNINNNQKLKFEFLKYIPKRYAILSDLFIFTFNELPRKLQSFLFELHAELAGDKTRYEYKKSFEFDLFNDDIDKIFAYQIIERGKKYYEEERVIFLEKIDDKYFAIVEGTEKYVVIIRYNEEKKEMQVYCSCPCEFYCKHIYAVILAIRNHEMIRFFKVTYGKGNLLEQVMNFDYKLCLGVVEANLEILNDEGELELVPIFDSKDNCPWKVLEDDENMTLAKKIQDVIHGNIDFD